MAHHREYRINPRPTENNRSKELFETVGSKDGFFRHASKNNKPNVESRSDQDLSQSIDF